MGSKNDRKMLNDSVFDWGSRQSFGDVLKATGVGSGNADVGEFAPRFARPLVSMETV
jgi:hypothetical protein